MIAATTTRRTKTKMRMTTMMIPGVDVVAVVAGVATMMAGVAMLMAVEAVVAVAVEVGTIARRNGR